MIWMWSLVWFDCLQGGEVVSRVVHIHEVAGSIPVPAIQHFSPLIALREIAGADTEGASYAGCVNGQRLGR